MERVEAGGAGRVAAGMARKDRAPNPPRAPRPQAPAQRRAPIDPASESKQRLILYVFAGSGVLALLVVAGVLLFGGGGGASKQVVDTMKTAGCSLESFNSLAGVHSVATPDGTSKAWNTFPPTSGPHYQVAAVYGSYDEPVNQAQAVHNLEHGAIVIQYGSDVPEAELAKLRDFYNESPNGMLVAKLPDLKRKIVLEAWTTPDPKPGQTSSDPGRSYLAKCNRFDEAAFKAFRDAYRGKGPERFPVDSLTPGAS